MSARELRLLGVYALLSSVVCVVARSAVICTSRLTLVDKHDEFLKKAAMFLPQAKCVKRSVAALVVYQGKVVGSGVNTFRGLSAGCTEGGCPRGAGGGAKDLPCIALHAEEAAVLNAGAYSRGSTVYVTHPPCDNCQRFMRAVGVVRYVHYLPNGEVLDVEL